MASVWEGEVQSANQHPDTPCASYDMPSNSTVRRPSQGQEPLQHKARITSISSVGGRPRGLSTASTSSVKRKPLPSNASPLATKFSIPVEQSVEQPALVVETVKPGLARFLSEDSPTLYDSPLTVRSSNGPAPDLDRQRNFSIPTVQAASTWPTRKTSSVQQKDPANISLNSSGLVKTPSSSSSRNPPDSHHVRLASESSVYSEASVLDSTYEDYHSHLSKEATGSSAPAAKPKLPQLTLSGNVTTQNRSDETKNTITASKTIPKSPGTSKLGSFFGWGGNTSPASSSTTFSEEKTFSPARSPSPAKTPIPKTSTNPHRNLPGGIDTSRANAKYDDYFGDTYISVPPVTPGSSVEIEEMEEELKTITAELATSIRREMELEDLVERLQSEVAYPHGPNKRTSDYFSDSGSSSMKYGGETDARADELDRLHRKNEREKAQIRLELGDKVKDERTRRKELEVRIRGLEQKASQVDLVSINSLDASGRLRELENTCEDLRRRLAEEKQVKDNFEDLLSALKGELEKSHNERDNLRDEIVPHLRARVEGLEAQAAEHEKLTYENTKMQQEMHALKTENSNLASARRADRDSQHQMSKFNSIIEETSTSSPRAAAGISRSNSVAQSSGFKRVNRPASLLGRSTSVKNSESREELSERIKDIENQRDALHRALKSLLERQEFQNRENRRRIRQLESERDRAFQSTPRRHGFNQEVANLREEINTLRRRADEAIEQKWQCEKGLSGLKMDLDRSEQEIGSLRVLLREHDIPISNGTKGGKERARSGTATSESLERAYRALRKAYTESLERVRKLEASGPKAEETEKALAELEKTLFEAVHERDFARQEAEGYRQSAESLQSQVKEHMSSETHLSDELRASAKRVEELAAQVRQQLASNAIIRQRLAETIDRGEKEQKANAARITNMQGRLRTLEEALMAAQVASEERVQKHEDEMRELKDSHNGQLLRVKDGLKSPRLFGPKSPLSPLFAGARSPRIVSTSSGKGISVSEESKADYLKQRVVELEKALEEADQEMQEVVGKMNVAQIEVMELQNEREEAVRQTKKLEAKIEAERLRGFEEKWRTMSSSG